MTEKKATAKTEPTKPKTKPNGTPGTTGKTKTVKATAVTTNTTVEKKYGAASSAVDKMIRRSWVSYKDIATEVSKQIGWNIKPDYVPRVLSMKKINVEKRNDPTYRGSGRKPVQIRRAS